LRVHESLMNGLLASKRCHSNSYIRNIRRWLSSNNNITNLQIAKRSYWNQLPILFGTPEVKVQSSARVYVQ